MTRYRAPGTGLLSRRPPRKSLLAWAPRARSGWHDAPASDPFGLDADDMVGAARNPGVTVGPGQRDQLVYIADEAGMTHHHHAPPTPDGGVDLISLEGHHRASDDGGELPTARRPNDHIAAIHGEVHRLDRRQPAFREGNQSART